LVDRLSSFSPQSHEFFLRSLRLIKGLRGNGNSSLRIACLRQSILYFFHHAKFDLAFEAAAHQHSVANQAQAIEAKQRSLNSMGTALAELGDVHQALIHYADALEIARYRESAEDQAIVLNNIGTALNYANLYRDAIPCFKTSLSFSIPKWKSAIAEKSATNLAQSLYYLERFDEALDAIRHALESKSPASRTSEHFDRALREFTLVQIALELGRSSLALEHAAKCREHALAAKSISRTLMARVASARCEVRAGNAIRGLEQLDRLVVECMKIDSMYKDALIAAVKANDEAGKPEQALSYMERLLRYARERRLRTIEALISSPVGTLDFAVDWQSDLSALEHNHAQLRAQVAERQVATSTWEMLERLAITADIKEEASGEHGYRVGRLSALLASRIGWSDAEAGPLELAGRLHDIGKIAIPERILGSSETLKGAERHFMCAHAEIGAELLARSALPQLNIAHTVARHHHERWDGSGYPDNLNGNRIPIHARIVAIADVFDTLTHGRPFSAPWTVDRAISELLAQRGSHFDPRLIDVFVALISDLRRDHQTLDAFLSEAAPKSPFLQVRKKIRTLLDKGHAETRSASLH
jgi:putative two-component system response regulator